MNRHFFIALLSSCFVLVSLHAFGQSAFDQGMKEFKEEKYEEAIQYFSEARKLEPKSSTIAYYLGLTYKLTEDYASAITHLRDAVTLEPPVKEALVELIDALQQTDQLEEARKWIEVGEKEEIQPARLQYLKGLVLLKEKHNTEAIAALEKAKELDKSLAQAAEFQIASALMREERLKEAVKRFRTSVTIDPSTDLGTFSREYDRLISDKLERERPWRFSVGFAYKYDTNLVAKPEGGPVADFISNQQDFSLTGSVGITYVAPFSFKGPYIFSAQYSLYGERFFSRDDYNNMTQVVTLVPGYLFKKVSLTIPVSYGYSWLQGEKGTDFLNDPHWFGSTKYSDVVSVNPTARIMLSQNNIGELSFKYFQRKYFVNSVHPAPIDPEEDRDAKNWSGTMGWMYFFKEGKGLLSLRYTYAQQTADGRNWSYDENGFGASFLYPLKKKLKFQATGDAIYTDYRHPNTGDPTGRTRRDDYYEGSAALIYELVKNTDVIGQYRYIRDKCNLSFYDYKREIFTVGMEYRF